MDGVFQDIYMVGLLPLIDWNYANFYILFSTEFRASLFQEKAKFGSEIMTSVSDDEIWMK